MKADETADETPEANPELGLTKSWCLYLMLPSDNFMTLFRGQLKSYLEELGFSKR